MSLAKQKELRKQMSPFEATDLRASVRQLCNTLLPLVLLWAAAYFSLSVSYALTLLFAIPAAGFVIRLFIIFHDCCHQSFFKSKLANEVVGTIAGVLTLCPYHQWKYSHSVHHATSGNLDKRGIGDIWVLTVEEYAAASFWRRLAYRLYRNPIIMFGLGPISLFLIEYRFNRRGAKRRERINTYITNVAIAVLYGLLIWAIGWQAFLLVQGPVIYVSGLLGIWLFYVQHQFEDSYYDHEDEWSYVKAAVEGSSYYKLPALLQWLSGNIGFHHVHHLSPKVPNYNLQAAHDSSVPLQQATTITLLTSLKSLRFKLWDEAGHRFVTFREARTMQLSSRPGKLAS
ncbi:fatty acid desaturase [Paenibacillus sp. SYP-B4298]|uniref:fatty acid desaturase n=1 Tax=Paenibacillus sp. SYP-B4298 TaxID=2996034 RepID=UPI0022DD2187|nr:fatty acid desaturase [Paenibacillus sp. SYP-B4298]